MKLKRKMLTLYAVTDAACIGERNFDTCVEQALRGGVTCLQLREKNLSHAELVEKARRVKKLCASYCVPLIINDDWQAAIEAGADGVHVGAEDTAVAEIRAQVPPDFIIGATAKSVQQARQAQSDGADYLGVGAVYPSPSKPTALRITNDELREIAQSVRIPSVAIGGITSENLRALVGCHIAGAAVISAVFGQESPEGAARLLRRILEDVL